MDEDRLKKIEAGREKLAAYKKKKQKRGKCTPGNSPSSHSSDSSTSWNLSLKDSPSENTPKKELCEEVSDSSTISEHLQSSNGSIEHDRSLQEIEISNSNFSLILHNLPDDEIDRISQENQPSSVNSTYKSDTIIADKVSSGATHDVRSILSDILRNDQFISKSERGKSDSFDSNDVSLNIFEGVSLDDSSINNYVTKLRQTNLSDVNDEDFNKILTPDEDNLNSDNSFQKIKQLEKQLVRKDSEIAALSAELDSLKELTSSLSTTDYKPYQEEYHSRLVEFQNAVVHRDNLIQQLTESLQQSILNREELQQQSENFAKEISLLQKQLTETSNIIKQHNCVPRSRLSPEKSPTKRSPINSPKQFLKKSNMDRDNSITPLDIGMRAGDSSISLKDDSIGILRDTSIAQEKPVLKLENECSKLEETLSVNQLLLMNELKVKINFYIQQQISEIGRKYQNDMKSSKEKLVMERAEFEAEISRLRELLGSVKCGSTEIMELRAELDAKHAKEMEELRTYFEKKCADVEKNYSDEIFSQQSRKMSGSSSCSDAELNSDIYPSKHPPGPGGDAAPSIEHKIDSSKLDPNSLSITDLYKIKEDLRKFSSTYENVDFGKLPKDQLKKIKTELGSSSLRMLAKYDWNDIKNDLQNKCHAELEILREDYDNRMDLLNVEHDVKMRNVKESYQEQIDALKYELNDALRSAQMTVSTAVQEVASSGEYELAEVVQSYERRLQEQVTLAKIDIISALEHQIQMLANSDVELDWPAELLQIRNRFTEKYEKQIEEIQNQQAQEISQLKEEHFKVLNGALERARRRSLRDNESITDLEIIKDRDNMKKTNSVLRHLLGELLKYFTRCEDELNKTLVDEIMKYGFDKNLTQIENELNESINSTSSKESEKTPTNTVTKRVHFTPNFSDFMNIVDASNIGGIDSKDLSLDLKNELGSCLERLKSDANSILALTTNVPANKPVDNGPKLTDTKSIAALEEKISSLTRQIITDSQVKNDLVVELEEAKTYVRNLESERVSLENQVEQLVDKQKVLEHDLLNANKKITDLIEFGHKEIVSEGYGQDFRNSSLGGKIANLAELQDKARTLVADWKNGSDHPLIQLVEELCREGERITDEAKKDKEDLRQQVDQLIDVGSSCGVKIEAADRKLRATCRFLEEQAMEREFERDESQREINSLKEQLKEWDKDKEACELVTKEGGLTDLPLNACCRKVYVCINSTVEHLEVQMREMTRLIELGEQKREEVENERKEAVDKIWVLRDIIRDLEFQLETKTEVETELKKIIAELEDVIKQQNKSIEDLSNQLETCRGDGDVEHLKERIIYLENETQKLRLNNELIGSEGALKEIQLQLHQFETTIDKNTRDLEGLHCTVSTTSCSSPSEDMSIRDQIRPQTPSVLEECDVPLQQLARLKEKLVKHSRAEEAALKRIRDVEMILTTTKQELEETQNEKEILQNQVTEQIVLLSSLQIRLDEQRLKAEHNQRQANSSLEVRIYDLESEVQTMKETIYCRDKSIKQLNKVVEETRERLEDRERELTSKEEDENVIKLQKEVAQLTEENVLLKTKIDSDAQNVQILPNLVDNIIADKNADIEKLREQLTTVQKQCEEYLSLNLDLEQLKQLSQLVTSERALSDILSLMDLSTSNEQMRKVERTSESLEASIHLPYKRNTNETTIIGSQRNLFNPEISSIEKEGPPNVHFSRDDIPLVKSNSTEIHKSLEKKVHFEDSFQNSEKLERKIADLRNQLSEKDEEMAEFENKMKSLNVLEENVGQLQKNLEETDEALNKITETFENDKKVWSESEKELRLELAEKKMYLSEKERQLELSEEDNKRKDQMYMSLAKEKRQIELNLNELQQDLEHYKNFDVIMTEKNKEIYHLEEQLGKLVESCVALEDLQAKLQEKEEELELMYTKFKEMEDNLKKRNDEYQNLVIKYQNQSENNLKLSKELKNKSQRTDSLTQEINEFKSEIDNKNKQLEELSALVSDKQTSIKSETEEEIQKLRTLLIDRECEIEILNEDITRYQNEIAKLEEQKKRSVLDNEAELTSMKHQKEIAERDLEILKLRTVQDDLNKEISHLQDHLQEKDRVIEQMKTDTKSLHVNLETIQNKIQETGNIVDLRKRLQEEQHVNAVLREEISSLKNSIEGNERKERSMSIEDIAGQVRQQLDYSAHLDSNILQALSSGDELNDPPEDVAKEQANANFDIIKTEFRIELRNLERKLETEREQNSQLKNLLEKEKKFSNTIQIEDANLIEQMRIRLEEALDNEKEFEKSLERDKKQRIDFENQISVLKQKLTNLSSSSNSKTEATEYKSLPNMESQEVLRLKEEIKILSDTNQELTAEYKVLKRAKSETEANLKYTRDMLQLKIDELEKADVKANEIRRDEMMVKEELMRNKLELEQKIREVENSRELMVELEKERHDTRKEILSLANKISELEEERKIENLAQRERDVTMNSPLPDRFLNKMKELTNTLKEHMEENRVMTVTLTKMTYERSKLLDRIRYLEDQNTYKIPFDDPISRANHLFGKYLRSESYRKALIWQKRYLIALLGTYQDLSPLTDRPPLSNFMAKNRKVQRSKGKQRFKCGAIAIISLVRMKFMVQRWHSGKRMAAYAYPPPSRIPDAANTIPENNTPSTQFQLGQPVSSQNFYTPGRSEQDHHGSVFPRSPIHYGQGDGAGSGGGVFVDKSRTPSRNNEELPAWSGITPPQKERLKVNNANISSYSEHLPPLETPHILSYFRRFNDIQQRLGMESFDNTNS